MWLSENAWPPMIIAGVIGLIQLSRWKTIRRRSSLIAAALCFIACGGFYFLERAIVTDAERLQGIVVKMAEDFRTKKGEVTDYVSNTAPNLKLIIHAAMAMVDVKDSVRLTDFQTKITNQNSRGTVHFRANATLSVKGHGEVGHQPARLLLIFQKEAGEWKVVEIERLNPLSGEKMEVLAQRAG